MCKHILCTSPSSRARNLHVRAGRRRTWLRRLLPCHLAHIVVPPTSRNHHATTHCETERVPIVTFLLQQTRSYTKKHNRQYKDFKGPLKYPPSNLEVIMEIFFCPEGLVLPLPCHIPRFLSILGLWPCFSVKNDASSPLIEKN